ncbi:MAG TPA: hypothetical protein VK856_02155 [Anaerolineaceae bacterium]|nr:hypothetical protein [Anaerolineaceae bacterium]
MKTIISKDLSQKHNLLKFKLIVKNGIMAFILNDELLGHYEDEQFRMYRTFPPRLCVDASPNNEQDVNKAGIDNFRVWNISDLEIP